MTELSLYERCLSFVEDQSSGEWGAKIERSDALKLVAFIQSLFPMERIKRISELLEANNRYLLRARKSEELLKDLADRVRGEIPTRFLGDVDEHLAEPWL
jgi:hypothetical protein